VLPRDVSIGSTVFRKGVKLDVLVTAATRWRKMAADEDKFAQDRIDAMAEKVAVWTASPEGKASLGRAAKDVKDIVRKAEDDRHIDPELLRKPTTI